MNRTDISRILELKLIPIQILETALFIIARL